MEQYYLFSRSKLVFTKFLIHCSVQHPKTFMYSHPKLSFLHKRCTHQISVDQCWCRLHPIFFRFQYLQKNYKQKLRTLEGQLKIFKESGTIPLSWLDHNFCVLEQQCSRCITRTSFGIIVWLRLCQTLFHLLVVFDLLNHLLNLLSAPIHYCHLKLLRKALFVILLGSMWYDTL